MSSNNPFTPMFGIVPPFMAGRKQLISEMTDAFENGYGDPNLSSIVIGARGTGKTALLTYLSEQAQAQGWITVNVTAAPNMLDDILDQTLMAAQNFIEGEGKRKLKSLNVGQIVGIEWENTPVHTGTWRTQMTRILGQLEKYRIGLLITVDEVKVSLEEMRQLVITYQHFIRERRSVGLLMAGLPHNVSDLLSNEDVSFIRRARQHRLGRIPDNDIRDALKLTIEDGGRQIEPEAVDAAVEAIDGFPYMMQLVGYRLWAENPLRETITLEDTLRGIELAKGEMETSILQKTYRELSDGDLKFLLAMLEDTGDSSLADIAERMGVKSNYASQYKRRLLERGIIGERGRGYLGFDMPLLKEYLREHCING